MIRLSSGGPECVVTVGSRLVWADADGRERTSRAIFLRSLSCRRTGLTGGARYDDCAPARDRVLRTFHGRVAANESYRRVVGPFAFELKAEGRFGWHIRIKPAAEDRDLTSFVPLHGPSSRDIQPPNAQELAAGRLAAHPFHFHPEMRKTIQYTGDTVTTLVDDLRVQSYGRGRLTVTRYDTSKRDDGATEFSWIAFDVCLSFPAR